MIIGKVPLSPINTYLSTLAKAFNSNLSGNSLEGGRRKLAKRGNCLYRLTPKKKTHNMDHNHAHGLTP